MPITAPILDSLRADYPGFDHWWQKVQSERRDVYVAGDTNSPDALCVMKVEDEPPSNVPTTIAALKLCTFKVADSAPGQRLGELMLKAAVDEARARGLDAIFVTVMPGKVDMLDFLARFGFTAVQGATTDIPGELVLEKRLTPHGNTLDALAHAIAYGPGAVKSDRAHIVPIKPRYVVELLPETQANIGLGFDLPTRACGNAIRKAYLSNSPSRKVRPGDLLAFYMSGSERSIVAVGVAEDTTVSRDVNELLAFVGTRTVYTPDEIAAMTTQGEVLAVLFRFDRVVSEPVSIVELRSLGVLNAAPQSFVQVAAGKVGTLCRRLLT